MKEENDLSYLSAMYYTAAVLLLLTAVFSALSHNWAMAAVWFLLGVALFVYRLVTSREPE